MTAVESSADRDRQFTDQAGLARLGEVVADRWFCVDDVTFDADSSRLTIPVGVPATSTAEGRIPRLIGRYETPLLLALMVVSGVREYGLVDESGLTLHALDRIVYDQSTRTINLVAQAPLRFWIRVDALRIELARTERLWGYARGWSFLFIDVEQSPLRVPA